MEKRSPHVLWNASGSIADPEIETDGLTPYDQSLGSQGPKVVPSPTRIDLFGGRSVLLLKDDELVLFLAPGDINDFPYYALLYYLGYRSRVNYNIVSPSSRIEFPETLRPQEEIVFSMRKLVLVEKEEEIAGRKEKIQYFESKPYSLKVQRAEIEQHIQKATRELHLAISYFLIGCEHIRYFLVEFYKAVESIRLSFGSERAFLEALKPYGLSKQEYKTLRRWCNDQRNPLDIARHAPIGGAPVKNIDFRRLLTEPLSKEVWTGSAQTTRRVIDAYSAYLYARTV